HGVESTSWPGSGPTSRASYRPCSESSPSRRTEPGILHATLRRGQVVLAPSMMPLEFLDRVLRVPDVLR
ncbi:hypothetical protein HMPREF1979_02381, partial [Actinomyces johnsonii F0542]